MIRYSCVGLSGLLGLLNRLYKQIGSADSAPTHIQWGSLPIVVSSIEHTLPAGDCQLHIMLVA